MMNLVYKLSWETLAKSPTRWGRKTTKQEQENLQREKHTPGRKKKKGRSTIKFDSRGGGFSGKNKPKISEQEGKKCGKSYISKDDTCHQDDLI